MSPTLGDEIFGGQHVVPDPVPTMARNLVSAVPPPRQVAIIGAGLMGRWHLNAAREAGAQVVLVIDQNIDAARGLAKLAPNAAYLADLDAALANSPVQAAHICTPVASHVSLAKRLLEAGIHTLVEKPLAQTASETESLIVEADTRGLQLCPVHQYAFQSGVEEARNSLHRLGRLCRIDFDICSAGAVGALAAQPDGLIAEILPHPLSIIQRLLPSASVADVVWAIHHGGPGEVMLHGHLGGTLLSIFISAKARPTRFHIRLQGEQGTAELDGFHGYAIHLDGRVTRSAKIVGPLAHGAKIMAASTLNLAKRAGQGEFAYPGLRALVRRFYAAAFEGRPPPISGAEVVAVARARDRILAGLQGISEGPAS